MGLFTPKISPSELSRVRTAMKQLQDSVNLINSTDNPEVFFKRLNFSLDLLLELRQYEKYKIFKSSLPSRDYLKIISNLEATVNDFIDRALLANERKSATLKTESAKKRNKQAFAQKLLNAFDCANTFWSGSFSQSRTYPHYTGPLYTPANYKRVTEFYSQVQNLE